MNQRILFLLSIVTVSLFAQAPKKLPNIAVIDLEARGITDYEAKTLSDKLRTELVSTGAFKVIERGQMDAILSEQGFQNSGCTSEECYVEMGQLIGVEKMLAGSIGKVGSVFLVSVRLIDVTTGEIDRMLDEQIQGGIEGVLFTGIPDIATRLANPQPKKSPAVQPVEKTIKSSVPSVRKEDLSKKNRMAVSANAVGYFIGANSVELEYLLGPGFSMGLQTYYLALETSWEDGNWGNVTIDGLAFALTARKFFSASGNMQGFYIGSSFAYGPSIDYFEDEYDADDTLVSVVSEVSSLIFIGAGAGYRLNFGALFVDPSLFIGPVVISAADATEIYYLPSLTVGYFF